MQATRHQTIKLKLDAVVLAFSTLLHSLDPSALTVPLLVMSAIAFGWDLAHAALRQSEAC